MTDYTDNGSRIFKPTYTKNGTPRTSRTWHVEFTDHHGTRRRLVASTDKGASRRYAERLEALVSVRFRGDAPDPDLSRWLEDLDDDTRAKLASWGLLDARAALLSTPLVVRDEDGRVVGGHLADYHEALIAKGATEEHADLRRARVLAILDGCGFVSWRDIDTAAVEKWLSDERRAGRLKARTSNHYVTAIRGFGAWMVRGGRVSSSPLASLSGVTVDDEKPAGVLTVDQVSKLLAYCQQATDRWGFLQRNPPAPRTGDARERPSRLQRFLDGPQRGLVYRFAVETALREGAIRSLRMEQIRFTRDEKGRVTGGTVRTTVGQQKNRKGHDVPLRRAFAVELAEALSGKAAAVRPFADLTENAAAMLRHDLFNAGLALVDEDGLPIRFHSFRATCATWLGDAGLDSKHIAAVTGHLTRAMVDHYNHATRSAGRRAIEKLPDLPALRATGTEGCAKVAPNDSATDRDRQRVSASRYNERGWGARVAERAGLENR